MLDFKTSPEWPSPTTPTFTLPSTAIQCYKDNCYQILADINLLHDDTSAAINAVHMHLLKVLRKLLHDEAYQLFQIFIQIDNTSPPSYIFPRIITLLAKKNLHP
jgi:hypothetical protein